MFKTQLIKKIGFENFHNKTCNNTKYWKKTNKQSVIIFFLIININLIFIAKNTVFYFKKDAINNVELI